MLIRGAPAIGVAAAFGMAVAARHSPAADMPSLMKDLQIAKEQLDAARPTAVNLMWATAHMLELCHQLPTSLSVEAARAALLSEAQFLADDDEALNRRLGQEGAKLVKQGANILHHCNTGSLATVYYGTALGVIYASHEKGLHPHVWVDETRPRLQGASLTCWELRREQVPHHLIVDSAAGYLMLTGKVDIVLFGADRVAENGDVVNKVGTYQVSVLARENGIPIYACVPTSTIDLTVKRGLDVTIEERTPDEILLVGQTRIAPEGTQVFNPAFDVTPSKYLSGIITEEGLCLPPFNVSLRKAKEAAERRRADRWAARLEDLKHKH